jgi:hypothetical protein
MERKGGRGDGEIDETRESRKAGDETRKAGREGTERKRQFTGWPEPHWGVRVVKHEKNDEQKVSS